MSALQVEIEKSIALIGVKEELEAIAKKASGLSDATDLKDLKSMKSELVTIRTSIEKKRKEIKQPFLDAGKKVDAVAKELTAICEPQETRIASVIEDLSNKELKRQQQINDARVEQIIAVGGKNYGASAGFMELLTPVHMLHAVEDDEFREFLVKIKDAVTQYQKDQEDLARLREAQAKAVEVAPVEQASIDSPAPRVYVAPSTAPITEVPSKKRDIDWFDDDQVLALAKEYVEAGTATDLEKALYRIAVINAKEKEDF